MNKIAKYLNEHTRGSAFSNDSVLAAYSTDRSILEIKPKAVAVPSSVEDIRLILRFSDQLAIRGVEVPVAIRGAGHGKTGACLSPGIVVSMEQMNRVSEIDIRQRLVRCQAGVRLGELNSALALHGLTIPIPADPDRTIGGLIADSSRLDLGSKPYPPHIYNHLEKAELVLPSGDLIQTEIITDRILAAARGQRDRQNTVYRKLSTFVIKNKDTLTSLLDPSILSPLGYASLAHLVDNPLSIVPLLFGSQGSLAVITEVILRADFLTEPPTYFFAEFPDIDPALEFASVAASLAPSAIDLFDLAILDKIKDTGKSLRLFPTDGLVEGYLVAVAFSDVKPRRRRAKLKKLDTITADIASATSTKETAPDFLELYHILLSYLNDSTDDLARLPLVDGAYVPRERFGSYLAGIKSLEEKNHIDLPIFGSCLSSTYSIRPKLDLATPEGRQFMFSLLRDYHELLHTIGGTLAGDTAEGRLLGIATTPSIDPKLVDLYTELKEIFDPHDILNPGIKHEVSLRSTIQTLRSTPPNGIIAP